MKVSREFYEHLEHTLLMWRLRRSQEMQFVKASCWYRTPREIQRAARKSRELATCDAAIGVLEGLIDQVEVDERPCTGPNGGE